MASTSQPTQTSAIPDPTAELKAALKDFEKSLTNDQKQLYKLKVSVPDAGSVTLFVADVASKNQGRHGKFLWKRLCPFLEATQQFTGIVNQFVSADPSLAGLIWGGVRTTLLAVGNATSYFEQVTNLIMDIGRLSPTFAEFGYLYTTHQGLQHALCNYYTVIVRICIKIVSNTRKNAVSHLYSTFLMPFELEFKPMLEDLTTAKDNVRDQISLASKQAAVHSARLVENESKTNDKFRAIMTKFRSDAKQETESMERWRTKEVQLKNAKIRDKIRTNLSSINYAKAWRQALQPRKPGTAEWFHDDGNFQKWISGSRSASLWCSGTMGTGKTVLTANIIAHLIHHKGDNDTVNFHFCRSDQEISLQSVYIVGTIARQLIESSLHVMEREALDRLQRDTLDVGSDHLVSLITPLVDATAVHYIVIDGLDECTRTEVSIMKKAMDELTASSGANIKILYSGRPELESTLFIGSAPTCTMRLSKSETQKDIEKYVDVELDKCLEEDVLKLSDPTLVLRIAKVLKDGSQGMFLWAKYFMSELCNCYNDHEILQALEHPPKGLSELLDTILEKVKTQKVAGSALMTLRYCGIAKRPLTIRELQEALSVVEGQQSLDRKRMPTDMTVLVAACRGLVFVDEIDETVHYVHHSLRLHLFQNANLGRCEFDESSSELALGQTCLIYLNFSDFQRQLTKTFAGSTTTLKPLDLGMLPISASSKTSSFIARKLLGRQSQLQNLSLQDLNRKAHDILEAAGASRLERELENRGYYFIHYAKSYWWGHFRDVNEETNETLWKFFAATVTGNAIPAEKPWSARFDQDVDTEDVAMIRWCFANNHAPVLSCLLRVGLSQSTRPEPTLEPAVRDLILEAFATPTALSVLKALACLWPFINYEETLIGCLDLTLTACNDEYAAILVKSLSKCFTRESAYLKLKTAVCQGMLKTVSTFLHTMNVDLNDGYRPHILEAAMSETVINQGVVDLLIAAGADVNGSYSSAPSPLTMAIRRGELNIVKSLVKAGAALLPKEFKLSPIEAVIEAKNPRLFDMFLDEILEEATKSTELLICAIHCHNQHAVGLLLPATRYKDQKSQYSHFTPLLEAIRQNQPDVAHELLQDPLVASTAIVFPLAQDDPHGFQTAAAAKYGVNFTPDMSLLSVFNSAVGREGITIASGTDYSPELYCVVSPLLLAVEIGIKEIVDLLLAAGAIWNPPTTRGGPLAVAIRAGHMEITESLISAGAHVRFSKDMHQALLAAATRGDIPIVESVLAARSKLDGEDADVVLTEAIMARDLTKIKTKADGHPSLRLKYIELNLAAMIAINYSNHDALRYLLQLICTKAQARSDGLLLCATRMQNDDIVDYLLASGLKTCAEEIGVALVTAAKGGRSTIVKSILAASEGIPSYYNQALSEAVKGRFHDISAQLVKAKVKVIDIDLVVKAVCSAAGDGEAYSVNTMLVSMQADSNHEGSADYPALYIAIEHDQVSVVDVILGLSRDPFLGAWAFQRSMDSGSVHVMEFLLNGYFGLSSIALGQALVDAAASGQLAFLRMLLSHKGSLKDPIYGTKALEAAVEKGHQSVVDVLTNAGVILPKKSRGK